MRIESLEIHTELLGHRARFHKIDPKGFDEAKNELWKEAQPYFIGVGGHIGKSDHDKVTEEILAKIQNHNGAEEKLWELNDSLKIVTQNPNLNDLIHNPYLREIATKNKKQSLNRFIKEAPARILKEIRATYKKVIDTNSVLPASLRGNHEVPDAIQEDDIEGASKAGEI